LVQTIFELKEKFTRKQYSIIKKICRTLLYYVHNIAGGFVLHRKYVRWKIFVLLIVLVGVILLLPRNVAADDDDDFRGYLEVEIHEAYYTDYDGDGYKDDIITIFSIYAYYVSERWSGEINVDCELETPSGTEIDFEYTDYMDTHFTYTYKGRTKFGYFEKYGIYWLDSAKESGWYEFKIHVRSLGYSGPRSDYESIIFDPPGGGDPGEPLMGFI
jgi:hypothetical protein